MRYLKIQNNGELAIGLIALMGGTTKSGKEGLIGQFGSGLKYTLAYLLRNNLAFKIYSGIRECKITTKQEQIADTVFDIIYINKEKTSITANMGKEWTTWMIVRELWANAIDEGDPVREIVSQCKGEEGKTTFYIQVSPEIQEVLDNWGKYFVHDQEPISETGSYKLYPGGKSLRIYKQGILIYEDTEMPAMFSYDIRYATINELREFNGTPHYSVSDALKTANEKAIQYYLEHITEDCYEGKRLDYDWSYSKWGEKWKEVLGGAKLIHQKAIETAQAKGINITDGAYIVVPEKVYRALTKQFDGIGALKVVQKGSEFYEQYCSATENRINQGLAILEACEYPIHQELEYRYGFFEDKTKLAQINTKEKVVYVSQGMLQRPLSDVVSMLIEENEHFNTGYADETREFQQHFIDLYTRQLLANNKIEV